ncbi:MAG TPA: hypothetical protein VFN21_05700, partial [Acidimicrobiales bacterium]|nr:hypothetical protein [Acidimicrobiales bacterium]
DLAELLVSVGRRGRATELIDEADGVFRDLGLAPDPTWAAIRLELHRGRTGGQIANGPARSLTATPSIFSETVESPRTNRHLTRHCPPPTGPNHRGGTS